MYKVKGQASSGAKLTAYASLCKYLQVLSNSIYCNACEKTISSDKKSHVKQHIDSSSHQSQVKLKETVSLQSLRQSQLSFTSTSDEFALDLCELFVALNIPTHKSKHPIFTSFVEKYVRRTVPSESTLRKTYLPILHEKNTKSIKDDLKESKLYAIADETTDVKGRYVCNILVGKLTPDEPNKPYLVGSKQLERVNNETVARCIDESLTCLFGDNSARENLLLLLTDGAAYMVKAAKALVVFYPKMIHITCKVHALHRVCEEIRKRFPTANKWVSTIKKVFLKAPSRVEIYKTFCYDLPLPPDPVLTRFGTWLEACVFNAQHFEKNKNVIRNIDPEDDAECVENARELLEDSTLPLDLICISASFGFLVEKIKHLESSILSLSDSVSSIMDVKKKLAYAKGEQAVSVYTKLCNVLSKDKGFELMSDVAQILNGEFKGQTPNIFQKLSVSEVTTLRYTPITTCEVERSFSMYKLILSDRRTTFTMENMEKYLVCHYFMTRRRGKET